VSRRRYLEDRWISTVDRTAVPSEEESLERQVDKNER